MYIFGKNVAKETLENNKKVLKAIISKDFNDKNIISMLEKFKIKIGGNLDFQGKNFLKSWRKYFAGKKL